MITKIEHCKCCGKPTGKADKGEDSFYITLPGYCDYVEYGPLCGDCYDKRLKRESQ